MLIKLTKTDVKFMTSDNDFCTEHLFISATVSKYHSFAETFLYPRAIAQYSVVFHFQIDLLWEYYLYILIN